jgi:hypothetical protein
MYTLQSLRKVVNPVRSLGSEVTLSKDSQSCLPLPKKSNLDDILRTGYQLLLSQ